MHRIIVAAVAASLFAGCSGGGSAPVAGGSSGNAAGSGSGTNPQSSATAPIADTNAVGSPLDDFSAFDKNAGAVSQGTQIAAKLRDTSGDGACHNGAEFFAPDRSGDPNSTETIAFFDTACTQEALDTVRKYSSTGTSSETVDVTESVFAVDDMTPIATRTETHAISGASFNQYGYPLIADGYDLVASSSLAFGTAKTIDASREFIIAPASSGSNTFCSDSASYNATGVASTGMTYGNAGGVTSGTRTINSDGSVTWTATHAGTGYRAAIGGLSIAMGTPNTACPIVTPDVMLTGGTSTGNYSIPVTATFSHGMLESLAITNATLSDGDTLNVSTTSGQAPSSSTFIVGSITNGTKQVATFSVNALGDGVLTITATGTQFVITDWHVVS